jgi:hypothetical protein
MQAQVLKVSLTFYVIMCKCKIIYYVLMHAQVLGGDLLTSYVIMCNMQKYAKFHYANTCWKAILTFCVILCNMHKYVEFHYATISVGR